MAPTRLRLALRHYGALRGPLLAVALVVLALAGLVAAAPAVFARLSATEIRQTTSDAPLTARYLLSHPAGRILNLSSKDPETSGLGEADPLYGGWQQQLADLRDGLPEPLRSHAGTAQWTISYNATDVGPNPAGSPPSALTSIATVLDVHPDRVARLVDGAWPSGPFGGDLVDIALSKEAMTTLGATVGTEFGAFRIVGVFEPLDASADYWLLNTGLTRANVDDDGNKPVHTTVTGFVGPQQAGWQPMGGGSFQGLDGSNQVWYPLELTDVAPESAERLLAQLNGVVAAPRPAPPPDTENRTADNMRGIIQEFTLSADVIGPLTGALGRITSASSVLKVALAGPLLAVLAVLIAAIAALLRRGRAATAMQATRGAGGRRLRLRWVGAGLLAGVPAAALAVAAVRVGFGASASVTGLVTGALVGLVPALLLALAPSSLLGADVETAKEALSGRAAARTSTSRNRSGRRWRILLEAVVLIAAGVSTYLLLTTGLDAGASDSATSPGTARSADAMAIAAPALLIAAACVIVLRLYPLPLTAVAAWARRRRGAVGFVGSLRALRDPIAGVVPAVAILAGVAVAGLSGALVTTLDAGTERAALAELGAPVRVTTVNGAQITDEQYAQINALPEVAGAARFGRVSLQAVKIPGRPTKPTAEVFLADLAALPVVQHDVPGAPAAIDLAPGGDAAAGIGSTTIAPAGTTVALGKLDTLIAETADTLPGITKSKTFLLLDSATTGVGQFHAYTMLVKPAAGADTAAVAAAVTGILGPSTVVDSATETVSRLRTGALAAGMRLALYAALVAAAAATIVALLISVLSATAARARLMAIARVLGLTRGQRHRLIIWEQAPVIVAALLGGAALGLGLAALVHHTVDLAPFTGGAQAPELVIDWRAMGALFAGFVAVVALAVAAGIALTRRTTAATAIKLDEE